ncbi:MAG: HIT domain-containing protein [Bacteriovoracaceae bacterium]|nr:HIT domain-containing protein [Bacteriovoracaceae bacterium]
MKIDERLQNDSEFICEFKLCQLRLMKDGELDWFLLIPRQANMKDWHDLELEHQYQLTREIDLVCKLLKAKAPCEKLNVANLGNIVNQFHVHVVARQKADRAWPGPIWGTKAAKVFDLKKVEFWKKIFENSIN